MLNHTFSETIHPHLKITNPCCPSCQKPAAIHDKLLQCCGLTAECVLIIEPPPVEIIRVIEKDLSHSRLIIDPYSVEPAFAVEKRSREQSRKSWIGYLPKTGNISSEVFHCFVEYQIPLPMCPRCQQPFEFRKDASDTEKPFCSEKTCQVFFSPSHFPKGTMGNWKSFCGKAFPLQVDEFRLYAKSFESTHVEPHELRSIGEVEFWKHTAMFAATSVTSETEHSETDTNETQPQNIDHKHSPQMPQSTDEAQENSPPLPTADASPQPDKWKDSCTEFIETLICEDPSAFMTRNEIYTRYQRWCEKNYQYCETRNALFEKIRQIEHVEEDRKRVDGDKLVRGFVGIRLL